MTKEEKPQNIIIENKKIQTQIKQLDIFELNYFQENPRINYMMGKLIDTASQDDIENKLWKLESVKDLYQQIELNGGLLEEIIVMGNKVIEGNSRLCAYRHLYSQAEENEKQKWRYIRAKVILEELTPKELFLFLGNLHIKGKTEWNPFEVASYINKAINDDGLTIGEVAKKLGMRQGTIEIKLKAYGLMKDNYLPSLPPTENSTNHLIKYSIFEEYFKNAELQKYTKEAPQVLNDVEFVKLVREEKIKRAAFDVRILPSILKDKSARKVFLNSDSDNVIKESTKILYQDKPEKDNDTLSKIKDMTDFLQMIEIGVFKNEVGGNERSLMILRKFKSSVNDFCNKMGVNNKSGGFLKKFSGNRKLKYV